MAFHDPYTLKRITDANFRYEFYTTTQSVSPKEGRVYYWFKGGAIHFSEAGMAGELLDGPYRRSYLDNQIAEQGSFKAGLRTGTWKTWHRNGLLETRSNWKDGRLEKDYARYDALGNLVEKGHYRKGRKDGTWIDAAQNDTVEYRKGRVYHTRPKLTKEQKKAAREEKECLREEAKKAKAARKEAARQKQAPGPSAAPVKGKTQTKAQTKPEPQPGFWKRLFSKKPKTNTHGKGQ